MTNFDRALVALRLAESGVRSSVVPAELPAETLRRLLATGTVEVRDDVVHLLAA